MLYLVPYALPLFLVILGLESRALTMVGAISALLMAYVILLTQDVYWLLIVLALFFIGTAATRYKEGMKEKQKLLQKVRGSRNIMANGGIAMLMALLGGVPGFFGFVGAIATATSDTVSSEIGVLSKRPPRMITNFKMVQPGTDGGVSAWGSLWAFIGAFAIGLIALLAIYVPQGVLDFKIVIVAVVAGVSGQFIDSFIGAVIEQRDWVGNSGTNLLATTSGAIIAMFMGVLL